MSYYHLPSNTERRPGRLETKLSDGYRIGPPDTGWTDELLALCGIVPIVDTVRPADTTTLTYDRSIVLVDGVPTVTWTPRAKTPATIAAETAATAAATNTGILEGKARQAVGVNNTFLALVAPSNLDVLKQVRALTRQMTALIKLSLRGDLLDNTDGT